MKHKAKELAKYVMDFAKENYNKYGWDFVVECLTLEEIENELSEEGVTTRSGALKFYRNAYDIVAEHRDEMKAFAKSLREEAY